MYIYIYIIYIYIYIYIYSTEFDSDAVILLKCDFLSFFSHFVTDFCMTPSIALKINQSSVKRWISELYSHCWKVVKYAEYAGNKRM